jgi:hypothetical protein
MKKNTFLTLTFVLAVVFTLVLAGCDIDITTDKKTGTDSGTTSVPQPDPAKLSPALRAVPTASGSSSSPKVLDSYQKENKNYYLVDVGYVKNTFVSSIFHADYNGMSPMTLTKTTINENTVTKSLTKTISDSITVSTSLSTKIGIEEAVKETIPAVGEFSVKLNFEMTASMANSITTTRSKQTSVSATEKFTQQDTTATVIGGHGEPAGNYRYALYAVCDVYFIITTSPDNSQLLGWDTVVCARDSTYTPHWDYSPDGIFDNSPDGNEITFIEGFYKNLPLPQKTEPANNSPTTITIDWKTIREGSIKVTDSGQFNQRIDVVDFGVFGINLEELKQNGYKTISFYIQLNVREIDDGYQHIFIYNSPNKSDDYLIASLRFEHSPGKKDGNWWVHKESELKFEGLPLNKFMNNEFIIRYDASGDWWTDDWENKDLKIKLVIKM